MSTPAGPPADENLQGLIKRGYTHPYSTHMLFRFPEPRAAAAFVRALLPQVQSAKDWGGPENKPKMMLNIGLTFEGLKATGKLTAEDLDRFPDAFIFGPTSKDAQRALVDKGKSDPSLWWGKSFAQADLHCIVHTYALGPGPMKKIVDFVDKAAKTAGVVELFMTPGGKARLAQVQLPDDEIHFGYRDGISEPHLRWPIEGQPFDAGTLNNFVIGYDTKFAVGPTGDNPAGRFARDGCYNAFRVISQDVAEFEKFLDQNAPQVDMPYLRAREWLAAKLIGRWRDGSPLEISPEEPDKATRDANEFSYAPDASGLRCPISAHVRVSNPRDEPLTPADFRVPRLIRRGMPYGPPPGTGAPDADRGLIGLFLCGALASQFELICRWMNTNSFSPLFSPGFNQQDAVVASREVKGADRSFRIPTPSGAISVTLPQFLTTRGTAYCLLPSIPSLRAIAES